MGKSALLVLVGLAIICLSLAFYLGLIPIGPKATPAPPPTQPTTQPPPTTEKPRGSKPPKPTPQPTQPPESGGETDWAAIVESIPHIYHKPDGWNKKVIIFVHGLGGRKETWLDDMSAFEELGYGTFAFDLPYHGERGRFLGAEELPSLVKQASDEIVAIAEYLRADGASEVYLISRSLGSIVSGVALGKGARIDKAELLLASADLQYVFTYGSVGEHPSWLDDEEVLREIDPMYFLPNYTGRIHFHCGLKDTLLTPEACTIAYNSAIHAVERELFWHDLGHSMPLREYFDEAREFFEDETPTMVESDLLKTVRIPPNGGDGVCEASEDWMSSPFDCGRPVLIVAFQLHIEEVPGGSKKYYDEDRATFERYADVLEGLAAVFEAHGAKLSIQTEKNFARADVKFGRYILRELRERGHGVGVQSHMGHHIRELGLDTDAEKLAYTREVKEAVAAALGVEPTNLGGGFEMEDVSLLGLVEGGLGFTSMTAVEKPYHQSTGKPPRWLHPWILPHAQMIDLSDPRWLVHDDAGGLVYIPGWFSSEESFEIDCRRDEKCFEHATQSLMAALQKVDDRFINVWWVSSHLYQTGGTEEEVERVLRAYDEWLTRVVDPLVKQGKVVWMTFDEIAQIYLKWERERLRYISSIEQQRWSEHHESVSLALVTIPGEPQHYASSGAPRTLDLDCGTVARLGWLQPQSVGVSVTAIWPSLSVGLSAGRSARVRRLRTSRAPPS